MSILPSLPDSYPSIQEIDVSELSVFSLWSQLDHHKAGGPDHVPARILKELAYDLTPVIIHLFKQSLDMVELPQGLKSAFVTSIFYLRRAKDLIHQTTIQFH